MNQVRHYRKHHLLLLPGRRSVISTASFPGHLLGCPHCRGRGRHRSTRGRQRGAFVRLVSVASVLVAAVLAAGLFFAMRNPALFTFRPGGTGASAGTQTDQQFIQSQFQLQFQAREVSRRPVDVRPAPR
jgi:hypothetical protein